jgi:hypothetical protein
MAKACYIYFALKLFDMVDTVSFFCPLISTTDRGDFSGALRPERQTESSYIPPLVPPHLNAAPFLGSGHLRAWYAPITN